MTEHDIRQQLQAAGKSRKASEIATALKIAPSTVKRWIDGGEIPPPMLSLLDLYFFGTIPFDIANEKLIRGVLDFSDLQWRAISILANRYSMTPGQWIANEIRAYLEHSEKGKQAMWEAQHGNSADGTNGK